MSANRYVTLTCDSCGAVFDVGLQTRVDGCRAAARREGWTSHRRSQDHCPNCKDEPWN